MTYVSTCIDVVESCYVSLFGLLEIYWFHALKQKRREIDTFKLIMLNGIIENPGDPLFYLYIFLHIPLVSCIYNVIPLIFLLCPVAY